MDTKTLWLGVLLILIFIIVINWNTINMYLTKNNTNNNTNSIQINNTKSKEGFVAKQNSAMIEYEYDKQELGEYPETIYEKAIKLNFKDYPALICNMIPTMKSSECRIAGNKIVKYKFPVHIIKMIDGNHLAVFNDGRLYKKHKLTDKMWQGPLRNSMPNRHIPLRMINTNIDGTKIIGVGYDNNVYEKLGNENSVIDYEGEWKRLPGLTDVIFIMFKHDESVDKYRYVVINTSGKIKITRDDKSTSDLIDYSIEDTPVLKLFGDPKGYMNVIDSQFRIRTFEDKKWDGSLLSNKYQPAENQITDAIYDNDALLFGCVILPKMNTVEVMKQEEAHFTAKFVPFEMNRYLDSSLDKRIADRTIVKSKLGTFTKQGLLEEDALDDDINMAYNRQMLLDKKRLRDFCANRGFRTDVNYKNYKILAQIEDNNQKIDKLNGIIKDLISFDPDQKAIQDSIIGINFLKDIDENNKKNQSAV